MASAASIVSQNIETVNGGHQLGLKSVLWGVKMFSYVNIFFCSKEFAWLLATRVITFCCYCRLNKRGKETAMFPFAGSFPLSSTDYAKLACEQAHLRVTPASDEEKSDPAGRSLVKSSRFRRSISILVSAPT